MRSFVRRWWNWWRLPRFADDDAMAEWFESADSRLLYLPVVNGVAVADDLKITITASKEDRS